MFGDSKTNQICFWRSLVRRDGLCALCLLAKAGSPGCGLLNVFGWDACKRRPCLNFAACSLTPLADKCPLACASTGASAMASRMRLGQPGVARCRLHLRPASIAFSAAGCSSSSGSRAVGCATSRHPVCIRIGAATRAASCSAATVAATGSSPGGPGGGPLGSCRASACASACAGPNVCCTCWSP